MSRIAAVLLTLPNGLLVVQRRGAEAVFSPLKLGFFGGHMEDEEEPLAAAKRELAEETSLDIASLKFELLKEIDVPASPAHPEEVHMYVFKAVIPSPDFEVFEGK